MPNANSVQVWLVKITQHLYFIYISIKPKTGNVVTQSDKTDIINKLKDFNVASITPVIEDTETTFLQLNVTVKFDQKKTTKTSDSIKSLVQSAITTFNDNNLQQFDQMFRHSKFIETVNKVDTAYYQTLLLLNYINHLLLQLQHQQLIHKL